MQTSVAGTCSRRAVGVRRCKQAADLGAGPHNLARFSRFGRFLALAGFGNLPGDLVIHERKGDAKWKQLAATR